ncbi:MAG TPA: hypothetical protein VKA94_13300, partial [Hyphomicrobiales bacterium]|nr:hypothetical protein [Hyphomicrobiales bacterium]
MKDHSDNQSESDVEPASGTGAGKTYFRITIRAPIHKVWAELTRTDAVLPFFFNGVCKTTGLAENAPMRIQSKDGKYTSVVGD